ncbi:hypothetical protein HDU76_010345 [Blyttiomyces sp. JEL0837]|nr:hypothetical protein HDU76_010345 [Blyttiomyces sp. JEL0837]
MSAERSSSSYSSSSSSKDEKLHLGKRSRDSTRDANYQSKVVEHDPAKEDLFKEGDIVFVNVSSRKGPKLNFWLPAMIVPAEEMDSSMTSKPHKIPIRERLVDDLAPFNPLAHPFTTFQKENSGFLKEPSIITALVYLNSGRVPKDFVWKYWGKSGKYKVEVNSPTVSVVSRTPSLSSLLGPSNSSPAPSSQSPATTSATISAAFANSNGLNRRGSGSGSVNLFGNANFNSNTVNGGYKHATNSTTITITTTSDDKSGHKTNGDVIDDDNSITNNEGDNRESRKIRKLLSGRQQDDSESAMISPRDHDSNEMNFTALPSLTATTKAIINNTSDSNPDKLTGLLTTLQESISNANTVGTSIAGTASSDHGEETSSNVDHGSTIGNFDEFSNADETNASGTVSMDIDTTQTEKPPSTPTKNVTTTTTTQPLRTSSRKLDRKKSLATGTGTLNGFKNGKTHSVKPLTLLPEEPIVVPIFPPGPLIDSEGRLLPSSVRAQVFSKLETRIRDMQLRYIAMGRTLKVLQKQKKAGMKEKMKEELLGYVLQSRLVREELEREKARELEKLREKVQEVPPAVGNIGEENKGVSGDTAEGIVLENSVEKGDEMAIDNE